MNEPSRKPLRAEQLDRTRARILDGLARVMASGIAEVTIPAVARAARVSVPTVYRHFSSKKALVAALAAHVARRGGDGEVPNPTDPESLAALTPTLFARLDAIDAVTRAAMASRLGARARRENLVGRRRAMIAAALSPAARGMKRAEREMLVNVVLILWSSASLQAFKDYLGLDAAAAAEHVAWAIRALTAARRKR